MEGNRTVMQEAIEYLKMFGLDASALILEDRFLKKEKQQIIDAYKNGFYAGCDQPLFDKMPEDYYNDTFR